MAWLVMSELSHKKFTISDHSHRVTPSVFFVSFVPFNKFLLTPSSLKGQISVCIHFARPTYCALWFVVIRFYRNKWKNDFQEKRECACGCGCIYVCATCMRKRQRQRERKVDEKKQVTIPLSHSHTLAASNESITAFSV